jgi:hypothetical protein
MNDMRVFVFEPFAVFGFGITAREETYVEGEIVVPVEVWTSLF